LVEVQAELRHARSHPGIGYCTDDESGQSLVELALALPALLLVVTGLMAFGVAFNNYMVLTDATAVGARQLTVSRGQTTDPCLTLANAVIAAAPLLTKTSLTFKVSLNGTVYSGTTCSGSSTSGAPANMILGTNAIVTVTYPYTLNMYGLKLAATGAVLTAQTTELMQ
jgi:Flp pilus assembly protein TadG